MAIKASDLAVRALKAPKSSKIEVGIDGYRGLVVIVYPGGEKVWTYRTRKDGRLYRERIGTYPGTTLREAVRRYAELRDQRSKGVDLAARRQRTVLEARRAPSVADLADDYIERHAKPNKRTWRQDAAMLKADVLPRWARLKAKSIERADVIALLDAIVDRGAPMQAGKVLALVRKLFNFGIERGVLAVNPATRIPRPTRPRIRNRVLADDEIRAFWHGLDQSKVRKQIRAALRLQLLTGQRIGEVLGARWCDVDLEAGTWLVPATRSKNRREHMVPLSPAAVSVLKDQLAIGDLVFPAARGDQPIRSEVAAHELAEALPKLGAGKFTTHDLRRTVETRLAALGFGREVRDRVLNHVDRSVGATHYNRHDYLVEKRRALDAWANALAAILDPSTRNNVSTLRRSGERA